VTTSGSVDFGHTRTQLIESALRKCGVLREGISATSDQLTTGALALNTVIKALQADGMPLWAIRESAVFPIHDVNTVTLGPSGGHAATTYVHTQLNGSHAASATAMTVDSTTGMSASDTIGIELDSGNIHWTTISGAPGSSTTLTLATGLATAAGDNSHVYTYTNKTVRPLKIIQAQRFDYTDSSETPVTILSRDEYLRIGNKTGEGNPNQIYYDPRITAGVLSFFPRFIDGNSTIKIWFQRPFEDMDAAGDTLDFPQEWESSIVWELAHALAMEHGVPERKMGMIQQKAMFERQQVLSFGQEEGSVYFVPEQWGR